MRPGQSQTGMKIEIVNMFTWDRYKNHKIYSPCKAIFFFRWLLLACARACCSNVNVTARGRINLSRGPFVQRRPLQPPPPRRARIQNSPKSERIKNINMYTMLWKIACILKQERMYINLNCRPTQLIAITDNLTIIRELNKVKVKTRLLVHFFRPSTRQKN